MRFVFSKNNKRSSSFSRLIVSLQFDSKKSPLALLAATCNNIGKDCGSLGGQAQAPSQHQNTGYPFFTSSMPANVAKSTSGRTLSCSSPVSEIKLTSPLGVTQHGATKLRLPTETDSLGSLLNVPAVSVCPTSVAKSQITTPPSMLKYMDKLSPIAATNEYAQLQAKFASALSNSTSVATTGAPMATSLGDIYDPFKLAAAIQQAKTAAAAAYMFPGSNPLSALSSLTSGASALSGVNTSLGSTNPISSTINTPSSNTSQNNTTCHLCPTSQFIVGGGHSPPKPGAGSPYITFVPVKTASSGTALVPVCADRGCLNCITAIRQAQMATNSSNCSHCTSEQQNKSLAAALAAQHNLNSAAAAAATGNPLAGVGGLSTPSSGSTFPFLPASLQAALQQPSSLAAVYQQLAAANAAAAAAASLDNSGNTGNTASIPTDASNNRTNSPSKLTATANQELHKCKWAPAGGGQPCGKSFASPEDLMDHIKLAHMMSTTQSPVTTSAANNGTSPGSQLLNSNNNNNSPTSVASAIEEVSTLQQLVNNRRLSPSSVTQPPTGGVTASSMLSSLQNLSAASNPLASLSSLSRKIPGTVDLASAISAAARYHPYSKFSLPSLPTTASGLSSAPSVASLAPVSSGLSGLNPASLNALLSNAAAASSFLMYDLPKA